LTRERVQELLRQVDEIEQKTSRVKVPASYANQFYELRGHLAFVRRRLEAARPNKETPKETREDDAR
jgi:hypothetical protein